MNRQALVVVVGFLLTAGCEPAPLPPPAAAQDALHATGPRVLKVGTWHGRRGDYATIQAAVDAARPGDWVLIAEGDYHEQGTPKDGVRITTPNLHLRGMSRTGVIVDGTRPGASPCSSAPQDQDFGPGGGGRDGIEVWQADGVTIENLTACNFLGGTGGQEGNQIWWNGGDGSGTIGLGSYRGAWLSATSTYFDAAVPHAGQYGIFVSNSKGPGLIERSYASNMADSSFYVGACADCNAVLRRVHAQNSALGYSGTNAGGHLIIEDSEWDRNRSGILPSSLANDDPPSPQDGACPDHPERSCTLIQRNSVHHNNNPNTPAFGLTAGSPIGTGIDLSGSRNDTVRDNLVADNGAWGILINDYPDPALPAVPAWCTGGLPFFNPPAPYDQLLGPTIPCYFKATGNRVLDNHFAHNGGFGNATNGDLGNAAIDSTSTNCFRGNSSRSGPLVTAPSNLASSCGTAWSPDPAQLSALFLDVICAAYGPASGACLGGPGYPQPTTVALLPMPTDPGMDDPCEGVPANSWCSDRRDADR